MTNLNKPLRYFIPPPIINSVIEYQDINKDPKLREMMTDFFYRKVIKWINKYSEFSHLKDKLKLLSSKEGVKIIYNLLREYTNKSNTNWYDLKDNYLIIKDYLKYKLGKI